MKSRCVLCFKTLSVESRVKILEYLVLSGEKSVNEITRFINLKQPTVSYHLKEMEHAGLVIKRADGRGVYYSISSNCPHDGQKCIVL
jgi:DNA-binding transcriptional ArsR family regulator